MSSHPSRREFLSTGLSAGLALPVLGATSVIDPQSAKAAAPAKLDYRTLGRTGLKVTTVGMGCMITSDPSVIARAADLGVNYFDTARDYQQGNNERLVAAGLGTRRKQVIISTKSSFILAGESRQ